MFKLLNLKLVAQYAHDLIELFCCYNDVQVETHNRLRIRVDGLPTHNAVSKPHAATASAGADGVLGLYSSRNRVKCSRIGCTSVNCINSVRILDT